MYNYEDDIKVDDNFIEADKLNEEKPYEKRVVFLDFDGVVNTPYWRNYEYTDKEGNKHTRFEGKFAWPEDGFVNNYQAICWLNQLYKDYPFDIIITSSWREDCTVCTPEQCLYNGGLNPSIRVRALLPAGDKRDYLIHDWKRRHKHENLHYLILDDDTFYYYPDKYNLSRYLVECNEYVGFLYEEYDKAKSIFHIQELQEEEAE